MQSNERAAKGSYKDVLRAKFADFTLSHGIEELDNQSFEDLLALVQEECLRSFKNGLAAGRKRPGSRSTRPEA